MEMLINRIFYCLEALAHFREIKVISDSRLVVQAMDKPAIKSGGTTKFRNAMRRMESKRALMKHRGLKLHIVWEEGKTNRADWFSPFPFKLDTIYFDKFRA